MKFKINKYYLLFSMCFFVLCFLQPLSTSAHNYEINKGYVEYKEKSDTDDNIKLRGLCNIDGEKYYYKNGKPLKNTIKKVKGNLYYFDKNGVAVKSKLMCINGKYLYFNSKGVAVKNSMKVINGKKYYFNNGGIAVRKKLISYNGNKYYFGEDGHPVVNTFKKIGGKKYYFNNSGKAIKLRFKTINGKKYYFNKKGVAVTTRVKVNGYYYEFNSKGELTNGAVIDKLKEVGGTVKTAFKYASSLSYSDIVIDASLGSDWYADYGLKNGTGNCYTMAAVFYKMCRALGVDAHQITGEVPAAYGGMVPHSWVEIDFDGETYVCDPQFVNSTGDPGYMFKYGAPHTWIYGKHKRMN